MSYSSCYRRGRLIPTLFLIAVIIMLGSTMMACGGSSSAPERLTTPPAPVETGYPSVILLKDPDPKKEYILTVKNIIGVKVENGDAYKPANGGWYLSSLLTLLVAVKGPLDTTTPPAQSPTRFIKLISAPIDFSVLTDVPADSINWLTGQVWCGGGSGFECNQGTYLVRHITIHLHSLDELH